jgi:hypothetical protein
MFNTKEFVENQIKKNKNLIKVPDIDQSKINVSEYITISDSDRKKININIDSLNKDIGFKTLINKLLFEVYENDLGLNEDKTKTGIIGVHPLNSKTNWSIMNYFGGHKFVKNTMLSLFVELHKPSKYNLADFYLWVIVNSKEIFGPGEILEELVNCNMTTYIKGSKTEIVLIEALEKKGYKVEYFCPGSKYDRDYGIDIIVTFKEGVKVSFQVKELTGTSTNKINHVFFTPTPKDYHGLPVNRIFLLNLETLDYVSFPNDNYIVDTPKKAYMVNKESTIKFGNIKDL